MSENKECRVCLEVDTEDAFIHLCNCVGSIGHIHRSCLEEWLNKEEILEKNCELCGKRIPCSRIYKPFKTWVTDPVHRQITWKFIILCFPFFLLGVYVAGICVQSMINGSKSMAMMTAVVFLFIFEIVVRLSYTYYGEFLQYREDTSIIQIDPAIIDA